MRRMSNPYNDALMIQAMIINYEVTRIFVDSESSINVLFKEVIGQMDWEIIKRSSWSLLCSSYWAHRNSIIRNDKLVLISGQGK